MGRLLNLEKISHPKTPPSVFKIISSISAIRYVLNCLNISWVASMDSEQIKQMAATFLIELNLVNRKGKNIPSGINKIILPIIFSSAKPVSVPSGSDRVVIKYL